MVRAGQSIENPVTGQRLIFRKTALDTQGAYLEVEWFVEPFKGRFPPEHVHPSQTERFDILSGQGRYRLGGVEHDLGPGDSVDLPANVPHVHPWSIGDDGLHMLQTTRPSRPDLKALQMAEAFGETTFGLARDGLVSRDGMPGPLQAAVIAEGGLDYVHVTSPPLAVQRAATLLLAPIGRLFGYRARYSKYGDSATDVTGLADDRA